MLTLTMEWSSAAILKKENMPGLGGIVTTGEMIAIGSVVFSAGGLWFKVRAFTGQLRIFSDRLDKLDDFIRNGGLEDKYVTRRECKLMSHEEGN
jgi:hypothetical protein